MKEVLGPSLVYELQSLLLGKAGPNLRNLVAHGLISRDLLNSESGFYLWWVLYRLTVIPTRAFKTFAETHSCLRNSE